MSLNANSQGKQECFRERLPIFQFKDVIAQTVLENRFCVISSETGSGKSTQTPQIVFEALRGSGRAGGIVVTQPRRVGAVSLARRVAEEMQEELGGLVGYSVRFDDCFDDRKTKIRFLTDGTLLREVLADAKLQKYACVIIDEAHERSLQTDLLLGILRNIALTSRPDLRIIITSATLDIEKFTAFFHNCHVISIPGRTHPVKIVYSQKIQSIRTSHYLDDVVNAALEVHQSQPLGDILVFLTGRDEIERACTMFGERVDRLIEEGAGENLFDVVILPVYAALPRAAQYRIFQPAPPKCRKVLFATNICETSLTVDGIAYVIDSGLVKQKKFTPSNSQVAIESLLVVPISKVAATQRAGRAGRTREGICWRLYSEEIFEKDFPKDSVPEIQRTNLCSTVLLLKELGVQDPFVFPFLDPPDSGLILDALIHLYRIESIDDEGKLTKLGHQLCQFPLEPTLGKLLIRAREYGCVEEMLNIVAMLSVDNIWVKPFSKQDSDEFAIARHRFGSMLGDHISLLFVYDQWIENGKSELWCNDHFLNYKSLQTAYQVRQQIGDIFYSMMSQKPSSKATPNHLSGAEAVSSCRRAIAECFFTHSAHLVGEFSYKIWNLSDMSFFIHPSSCLSKVVPPPNWIIYDEVVYTSKPFMRRVCVIEYSWIKHLLPRLKPVRVKKLTGHCAAEIEEDSSGHDNSAVMEEMNCAQRNTDVKDTSAENDASNLKIAQAKARYLQRKQARGRIRTSSSENDSKGPIKHRKT